MTSAILAWAIKAPDGKLFEFGYSYLFYDRERKLQPEEIAKGYRCVRVRVEEIEE
ncbi:MAG: hypothetical protein M0Q91_15145 [Methanoregula sp.]|jgi:hypothetical protein|nr:hypothetical protein [Methanoregula sp.]